MIEPTHPELERAIDADPEDPRPYEILADWLQARGVARGELIALQLRAEREPELAQVANACLRDHAAELHGELPTHVGDGTGRPALVWRRGFIDHATVATWPRRYERDDDDDDDGDAVAPSASELLAMLVAHPSARHLRGLVVGAACDAGGLATIEPVIATLLRQPPDTLRSLQLGDNTVIGNLDYDALPMGDLAPLWRAFPDLHTLVLHGGPFQLGAALDLPALRHLQIRSAAIDPAHIRAIAAANREALEHLELSSQYDDVPEGIIDALIALLGRPMPLRELALRGLPWGNDLCPVIASTLRHTLRALYLGGSNITDAGVRALAELRLDRLDLSRNLLTSEGVAIAWAIAREVLVS